MANWFERNPTPAIVTYTFLIVTGTWAVSTFILKDNRIALVRSELEAQKVLTEQWRQKTELLQKDLEHARSENSEYREWLGRIDGAIPAVMPRITELKERVSELEAQVGAAGSSGLAYRPAMLANPSAGVGSAFVDDTLGLIFSVKDIHPDGTAEVSVQFPDRAEPVEENIIAGKRWTFVLDGVTYGMVVTDIYFVGDRVNFRVVKMGEPKTAN